MTLATANSGVKRWAPQVVTAVICAASGWLASTTPADSALAAGFRSALADAIPATPSGTMPSLTAIIGFVVFGLTEAFICKRLPNPDRVLATICVLSATVVYQWVTLQFLSSPPHPLAYIVTLAVGFGCGAYLRVREASETTRTAHHYELKLRDNELLETRLELLKQDEIERRTLAADLHDQVLNDLKQLMQRFDEYLADHSETKAAQVKELTNQVMVEIREVMDALSPSVLEHLGLPAAIEDCLRRGAKRSGFKIRFKNSADETLLPRLSIVEQGLLYRLVQESITNVCKHANASLVKVTVATTGDTLSVKIIDDGRGIDLDKMSETSRGLKYMRYRAELIGARITWNSGENGKGTTVEIQLSLGDRT